MNPEKTGASTPARIFERVSLLSFGGVHESQNGGALASEQYGFMGIWQDGQSGSGSGMGGVQGGGVQSNSARTRSQLVLLAGLSQPK